MNWALYTDQLYHQMTEPVKTKVFHLRATCGNLILLNKS